MSYEDPREREKRSTEKCICKQGGLDFCLYPEFHYPPPLSREQQQTQLGEVAAYERVLYWMDVRELSMDTIREYITKALGWMVTEVELAKKYDFYCQHTPEDRLDKNSMRRKYDCYVPIFKEKGWKV